MTEGYPNNCHFPFTYKNETYYECTDKDNWGVPWCSTSDDGDADNEDNPWANCQEAKECKFPTTLHSMDSPRMRLDMTFDKCTFVANEGVPWCNTTDGSWGNCDLNTCYGMIDWKSSKKCQTGNSLRFCLTKSMFYLTHVVEAFCKGRYYYPFGIYGWGGTADVMQPSGKIVSCPTDYQMSGRRKRQVEDQDQDEEGNENYKDEEENKDINEGEKEDKIADDAEVEEMEKEKEELKEPNEDDSEEDNEDKDKDDNGDDDEEENEDYDAVEDKNSDEDEDRYEGKEINENGYEYEYGYGNGYWYEYESQEEYGHVGEYENEEEENYSVVDKELVIPAGKDKNVVFNWKIILNQY